MRAECISAVQLAAQRIGKTLTAADFRNIEGKIAQARKQIAKQDINAYRTMTTEEQLAKAGERVVNDAVSAALNKRLKAELTITRSAEINAQLESMKSSGLTAGEALDRFFMSIHDGRGGVLSIEAYQKGMTAEYMSKLPSFFKLMDESSFAGVQTSSKNMMDYLKESYGIDSGNPLAKQAWREVDAVRTEMIKRFNRNGGDIAPLANYRNPQNTDQYTVIRRGGKEGAAYIDDYMQWVDRSEYVNPDGSMMSDAQMRDFLKESYITIATNGESKPPGERGGAGMVANRNKAHRQIHYKSPEAYLAAMDKYGAGNVFDQVRGSIESMARDISLVEKFTPNPNHMFDKLYADAKHADPAYDKHGVARRAFDSLSGMVAPGDPAVAHWMGTLRSAMVASRLGSMLISQLADVATIKAVANSLNVPVSEVLKWQGAMMSDADARQAARSMALGMESALDTITRWADGASVNGFFGKAAMMVPTIQGAHLWTRMWRQAVGTAMSENIANMAAKFNWATLHADDRTRMERLGVTEQDFGIWKLAQATDYKGSKLLGAANIDAIPTADIARMIPDRVQAIMDRGADLVTRLTSQTGKEMQWVAARAQKLADYKAKIQKAMDDYESLRKSRVEDVSDRALERAGELMLRAEKADADMEFAKKSIEAMNERRTDKFMEEVQRGVEWYGRRRSEIGERLGAKRHSSKLASARNEAAIEKIGKELSAKFNELFGPERTEDGFKVVGDVVKAAKEYEAYAKKMEDRIDRSTRKDGAPKAGKEGTIERAERLSEQAKIEYEAIRQKADAAIENLRQKSEGKIQEIEALQKLVDQQRQRAENEADIASYLETEKNRDKVQGLLDTLEFRANQGGERMMSEGERIGYRKAMMDSQLKQMDRKVAETARVAGKEVFAKASEFEKRIDKRVNEMKEFSAGVEQRAQERQQIIDEWNSSIGRRIEKEAEAARQEAATRLTAFLVEQSHQAVLQPGIRSQATMQGGAPGTLGGELTRTILQFKSFPMAMWRQMFIERATFDPGMNPVMFRAKLVAMGTLFGGLALVLNDIANGKDPRQIWDSDDPKVAGKFAVQSMLKGGGIGFFADMIDTFVKVGENPYSGIGVFGPIAGWVGGSVAPMAVNAVSAMATQDEKEIEKFTKFAYESVKGITPGQNLWFLKGFLHNVILDDLQEIANPGYKQRVKQRMMENYGHKYWMGMDEQTRPPEFGNMVQP